MLTLPPTVRVFFCLAPADMRRSLDGLAALIMATTLEQGRSEGHFFGIVGAEPDYLIIVEPPKDIARVADSRLANAIQRQNGYGLIITP
ncbi:MAG TPA: hypothetical protein VLM89_12890 [Phycisphaerae bacterium]|nr:hypothetical protein [Phycisphaerae bacterium]